jgi:hypothetical protein
MGFATKFKARLLIAILEARRRKQVESCKGICTFLISGFLLLCAISSERCRSKSIIQPARSNKKKSQHKCKIFKSLTNDLQNFRSDFFSCCCCCSVLPDVLASKSPLSLQSASILGTISSFEARLCFELRPLWSVWVVCAASDS